MLGCSRKTVRKILKKLKSGGSKISTRCKIVDLKGISVSFLKANFPKNQIFSEITILRGFKRFFKSIAESINNLRKKTGNILDDSRVKTVQIFNYRDVSELDSGPVDNLTRGGILSITKNGTFYLPFTIRQLFGDTQACKNILIYVLRYCIICV